MKNMGRGIRKALIMNNPKMRAIAVSVNGTAGTPAASGIDASQIESVTDNGAGDYTITLKFPFNSNSSVDPIAMVSSKTAGVQAYVTAIDYNVVTVEAVDTTDGSTATDCDFDLYMIGNDGRLSY